MKWSTVLRGTSVPLFIAAMPFLLSSQDPSGWDDIHFESGSISVAEGYSSLARLARVLAGNRYLQVRLTGHADALEDKAGAQNLSLARAAAVKSYLTALGVSAGQIEVRAAGSSQAVAGNETKEGRFRNRRVTISITDLDGRIVKEGGINDVLATVQDALKHQDEADNQTLKRLDKLDDILASLKTLQGDNSRLTSQVNELRNQNNRLRDEMTGWPKPPTQQQIQDAVRSASGRTSGAGDGGPWWSGGLSGRSFLVGKAIEDKRYGLYSYLLIPRQPVVGEPELKKKYVAALDAYQAMIDTVAELRNVPNPPALNKINITYLPLQYIPEKITSDRLLEANNSALAKELIQILKAKHPGVETREGPFIISYAKPLIGLDRVEGHLFIDMSQAPADVATLYVRAFLTQAGRERYWEKDRDQWVLGCYAFIENAGGEFANVSRQFKEKSFLATIFGWFK